MVLIALYRKENIHTLSNSYWISYQLVSVFRVRVSSSEVRIELGKFDRISPNHFMLFLYEV